MGESASVTLRTAPAGDFFVMSQRPTLIDALKSCFELDAGVISELAIISSTLPGDTLAWAVQQLVVAATNPEQSICADVQMRTRQLAVHTSHEALLVAWTKIFRELVQLPPLDEKQMKAMLDSRVIAITTVDGFAAVARQFASARLTTELLEPLTRKSTPPVCRVATPPSAAVEQSLQ